MSATTGAWMSSTGHPDKRPRIIWNMRAGFLRDSAFRHHRRYRHTFFTMLYEAGIDLKSAQRWMGHADEQMILRVYAHLTDRQEQRATEKLRAFIAWQR